MNIGVTLAIAVAVDKIIEENKIPDLYEMILQIGSREHVKKDGKTGQSWKVSVRDFTKRAMFSQEMLDNVSRVLNSGEFITTDEGFSASVLFMSPETKGGKPGGYSPGQKLWEEIAKESRCVCEIKNKDELCCALAIVTMREFAKREKGELNTFDNIGQDRGINSQQLKKARKLHQEADVPEGSCGTEESDKFQDYVGPQGYKIIVVCAQRGGVVYTGKKFKEMSKIIRLVKSAYVDENGETKAHYDGLYSTAGYIYRSYFCDGCCKGYNNEDVRHHDCLAQNCPACLRRRIKEDHGCGDFESWTKPEVYCKECNCWFYGKECFEDHLRKKPQKESAMMK